MVNVLGICNLHNTPDLGEITKSHPLGAVSFLGRYALMDFTLSNFSNSGIDNVAVLISNRMMSIQKHVKDGLVWNNNSKTGYLRLFLNEEEINKGENNTDIRNVLENYALIEDTKFEYVIMAPAHYLMSFDFNNLLEKHIATGADLTLVYKNSDSVYKNAKSLQLDGDKVTAFDNGKNYYLDTFVCSKKVFHEMIESRKQVSNAANFIDMVTYYIYSKSYDIRAYSFEGYVAPILCFEDYINESFKLLKYKNRSQLFNTDWPILTSTHNTAPALYSQNADVSNSFIANGSIIKGTVNDSIISREVLVEEGAVVENCILFTNSVVEKGVKIQNLLADKEAKICENVNSKEFTFLKGRK